MLNAIPKTTIPQTGNAISLQDGKADTQESPLSLSGLPMQCNVPKGLK
jgi:hypothetical protein